MSTRSHFGGWVRVGRCPEVSGDEDDYLQPPLSGVGRAALVSGICLASVSCSAPTADA